MKSKGIKDGLGNITLDEGVYNKLKEENKQLKVYLKSCLEKRQQQKADFIKQLEELRILIMNGEKGYKTMNVNPDFDFYINEITKLIKSLEGKE